MKIESVDFFYLSMPEILDIGDGSQDAVLVRISAGGFVGWGECEAAPLPTIASYVCPMSHSACKPVKSAVEGKPLNDVADIQKINQSVRKNCFDLLQAAHTFSGIDIALWDLLGKYLQEPVYKLLGYEKTYPKIPYASQLFGDTPEETFEKAKASSKAGYKAVKFGWGPIGKTGALADSKHFHAAREGLGEDPYLMVDIGTIWNENEREAGKRLKALNDVNIYWLEEPFTNMALSSYKALSGMKPSVPLAGGEGCNSSLQAIAMMDYGGLEYIQIDTGRIGGITAAKRVAEHAKRKKIAYVNHTFTSHLAFSASLQPYAGLKDDIICEYPVEPKRLAQEITKEKISRGREGMIHLPEKPGLGVEINTDKIKKYLIDMKITIKGKVIYGTPEF